MALLAPTRGRPTAYVTTPALAARRFQSLWEGFVWHMPMTDGPPVSNGPVSLVGMSVDDYVATWSALTASEIDEVDTPWGKGYEWLAGADGGDGIQIAAHGGQALNGTTPFTFAMLFKWDGTTGDERALVSQGGSSAGLRLRIANAASPASLRQREFTLSSLTVTADVWYMLVDRPHDDFGNVSDMDVMLINMQDGTRQHQRATPSATNSLINVDDGDILYVGAMPGNDQADGVTIAGAWFWSRRLASNVDASPDDYEVDEILEFCSDPWGMFKLDPSWFDSGGPPVTVTPGSIAMSFVLPAPVIQTGASRTPDTIAAPITVIAPQEVGEPKTGTVRVDVVVVF